MVSLLLQTVVKVGIVFGMRSGQGAVAAVAESVVAVMQTRGSGDGGLAVLRVLAVPGSGDGQGGAGDPLTVVVTAKVVQRWGSAGVVRTCTCDT